MAEVLEIMMVICFGISWPISIVKSLKMKCSTGKSPLFVGFIVFGYICGITSKIIGTKVWLPKLVFVFVFYCINLAMTSFDLGLVLFYKHREKKLNKELKK